MSSRGEAEALQAPVGADWEAEALALAWLDQDRRPRLLLGEGLVIIWLNGAAEREFARRRDIEKRGDLLATTDPARQADLTGLLSRCEAGLATLCLKAENGDGHILFRARRLVRTAGAQRFGMSFHRSGSEYKPHYVDLDIAFNLTKGETRVLYQLVEGLSADEVARKLGVSTETARSHIRAIYAKLQVSSREGLFHRISAYQL
jgi:DNA-binding CsgD family transcriptional regulator